MREFIKGRLLLVSVLLLLWNLLQVGPLNPSDLSQPEDFNPVDVREPSLWDVGGPVVVVVLLAVVGGLLLYQWRKSRYARSIA